MTPWAGCAPATPATPLGFVLVPSGKHAAFRDWDAPSLAGCTAGRWYGGCANCAPANYASGYAKHRADVAA